MFGKLTFLKNTNLYLVMLEHYFFAGEDLYLIDKYGCLHWHSNVHQDRMFMLLINGMKQLYIVGDMRRWYERYATRVILK